jgi:hypothetical protein
MGASTHVLRNADIVGMQEGGDGAFATSWRADEHDDALLGRRRKTRGAARFCSILHDKNTAALTSPNAI